MNSQTPADSAPKEKTSGAAREFKQWAIMLVVVVLVALLVRTLLFASFEVQGQSMEPNFHTNERIIVNKLVYDFHQPQPGDVIVLKVPSKNRDFIKRVIAVGGDKVSVEGDTVTVNGTKLDEPYIAAPVAHAQQQGNSYNINNFPTTEIPDGTVPDGYLFVMGDNRSNSEDSRMIGYIPVSDVIGRADVIFWPAVDMQLVKSGEATRVVNASSTEDSQAGN
ncbi:signal peptidase I [Paenibacillus sp. WLX1005]|uniref:signal peptidase I n=1 Tax=Paenibacillus sp. WLX1005 TaxID=3243766 RepID=UPI0039845CEB